MNLVEFKKFRKFNLFSLVFLIWFILLLISARANPDAHHDGITLFYANMTKEGMLPNRDFPSQWGPLYNEIISFPMYFVDNLVALRYFGILSFGVLIYLVYLISKELLDSDYVRLIPKLICLSYPGLVIYSSDSIFPFWNLGWPNMYGFLLILLSFLFFVRELKRSESKKSFSFMKIVVISILLQSAVYIRVNFLPLSFSLGFAGAIILYREYNKLTKFALFVFMNISTHIFACAVMMYSGMLDSWLRQNVIEPFSNDSTGTLGTLDGHWLVSSLEAHMFLSLLIFSLALIYRYVPQYPIVKFVYVFALLGLIMLHMFFVNSKVVSLSEYFGLSWIEKTLQDLPLAFISVSLVVFPAIGVLALTRRFNSDNFTLILMAGCFGSIPLMHNMNVDYVWMNCFFLVFLFARVSNLQCNFINIYRSIFVVSIHVSILWFFALIPNQLLSQRYYYIDEPLNKMFALSKVKFEEVSGNQEMRSSMSNSEFNVSLCRDYLYDVPNPVGPMSLMERDQLRNLMLNDFRNFRKLYPKYEQIFICNLSRQEFKKLSTPEVLRHYDQVAVNKIGTNRWSLILALSERNGGG